jgi:hypothetical protein
MPERSKFRSPKGDDLLTFRPSKAQGRSMKGQPLDRSHGRMLGGILPVGRAEVSPADATSPSPRKFT